MSYIQSKCFVLCEEADEAAFAVLSTWDGSISWLKELNRMPQSDEIIFCHFEGEIGHFDFVQHVTKAMEALLGFRPEPIKYCKAAVAFVPIVPLI